MNRACLYLGGYLTLPATRPTLQQGGPLLCLTSALPRWCLPQSLCKPSLSAAFGTWPHLLWDSVWRKLYSLEIGSWILVLAELCGLWWAVLLSPVYGLLHPFVLPLHSCPLGEKKPLPSDRQMTVSFFFIVQVSVPTPFPITHPLLLSP